jgi:hypothetical protein
VTAPAAVLALYAAFGMLGPALLARGLLWLLAITAARTALAPGRTAASRQAVVEAPRAPWVLMNPRSGGGMVERFGLVDKARAAGCRDLDATRKQRHTVTPDLPPSDRRALLVRGVALTT